MIKKFRTSVIGLFSYSVIQLFGYPAFGQAATAKYVFTLEDVVQLAKEQSLPAIIAKQRFRANYYNFMSYKATFLPKLTLTANPTTWDQSIRSIQVVEEDKLVNKEIKANTFSSTAGLSLSQNIGLTGGNVSLGSDFLRYHNFEADKDKRTQYTTTPVRLSLYQPLNGYNYLRWQKEIEPLRYEEAKLNYIVQMENVAYNAVNYFFSLAIAQVDLKMMESNFANTKELYEISMGRYNIGTIAEDALLQVQLRFMRAERNLNSAKIDIESALNQLRSFLGFRDNVEIELLVNPDVPNFKVPYEEVLDYAMTRNPDIISYQRQILEAKRALAEAKSQTGVTMELSASFGVNNTGDSFNDAYSLPYGNREGVNLRINVPILDWKQARNRYLNAKTNLEVTETQIQQAETDFKQDIYLQVVRFNMQENQLRIAAMADTIALKGYDVSYQRYMIGRGNITDLNIADTDKDQAKREYMSALQSYWRYYFTIRRLTLFDFLNGKPIDEDFDKLTGD
jgi:outer membrane protein TolC